MRAWLGVIALAFFAACARNGREHDWGASCSEIKQNHREISRIEEKLAALEKRPASGETAEEIEGLMKRRRKLLKDSDDAQKDCRPIY